MASSRSNSKFLKNTGRLKWLVSAVVGVLPVLILWILEFPVDDEVLLAIVISAITFVLFFLAGFGISHLSIELMKKFDKMKKSEKFFKIFLLMALFAIAIFLAWYLITAGTTMPPML